MADSVKPGAAAHNATPWSVRDGQADTSLTESANMGGMFDDGVGDTATTNERLAGLLEAARRDRPIDRISYRDALAAEGMAAVPAMTEWLLDPRLGAFAVRVLTRIGADPAARSAVARALSEAEPEAPSAGIRADIIAALSELHVPRSRGPRAGGIRHEGPLLGLPGVAGRRYWAMRTSDKYRDFIWAEAMMGRLRQGWGWADDQDLRRIADTLAAGLDLADAQRAAWRARRMLDTEPDGMQVGDLIVTQHLPRPGYISVFGVTGAYSFAVPDEVEDFGHIIPVELLEEDINRHDVHVTDALRRTISLPPRLYEITPFGGDVEALVAAARP
jgi:hypothetical protein